MEMIPFWQANVEVAEDTVPVANAEEEAGIGVDFSFFSSDKAKKITNETDPAVEKAATGRKKSSKPKVSVNGEVMPDRELASAALTGDIVSTTDYAGSYTETNNMLRGAIMQTDELSSEVKEEIDKVRSSSTLKGKYTYLTALTTTASSLLTTKISAIKELNSTITQAHNLELNRMKALKLDKANEGNDEMRMMDIYSAFINTPIGTYNPNAMPGMQDLTLGVNSSASGVQGVEMASGNSNTGNLTPEQVRMRMEANPNIQTVVRYDQTTGQRIFDVIDKSTGMSVPNYPRPDSFLLEDTTIDIYGGIARNRNVNQVWPLIVEGSNAMPSEY